MLVGFLFCLSTAAAVIVRDLSSASNVTEDDAGNARSGRTEPNAQVRVRGEIVGLLLRDEAWNLPDQNPDRFGQASDFARKEVQTWADVSAACKACYTGNGTNSFFFQTDQQEGPEHTIYAIYSILYDIVFNTVT